MASVILAALGFGHLSDGTHDGSDREEAGEQWVFEDGSYFLEDIGDGRKWCKSVAGDASWRSWVWAGKTEIYASCKVYRTSSNTNTMVAFFDGATLMGSVVIDASGYILYSTWINPDVALAIQATSIGTVPLNTLTHIEVRVIFHSSTGSVKIWLNGVLDSETTGLDTITGGTSCTLARLNYYLVGANTKFTDYVIHNDSAPLGDVGVYYLPANGDGVDTDFTPLASTNASNVDEIGPDEDTTYNESDGTAGHRDSMETAGIAGIAPISVGHLVRARKTGGGVATILPGTLHSGTEDQGAARTLSEDYQTFEGFDDDVPGGSGWTLTQIGNAEASYEVGA